MLQQLLEARRLGLAVPATLLVKAFVDARGYVCKTLLAHELGVSVRTVERSLAELKALGISSSVTSATSTSVSHDHDHEHVHDPIKALSNHQEHVIEHEQHERSREVPPELTVTSVATEDVESQLAEYGVLPWCIKVVAEKCEPQAIAEQLRFHAFRLASGFQARTEGGSAKLLFRACLNNWPAPKGFYEQQARGAVVASEKPVVAARPAVTATAAAAPIPRRSCWARCRVNNEVFPVKHWFGDSVVLVLPDAGPQVVLAESYSQYDWLEAQPAQAVSAAT
jgi:hypothetical protein